MRTQIQFHSTSFPPYESEDEQINPGVFGKRLADFLAENLPAQGFKVRCVGAEDWGWMVELENETFPLWIGCANIEGFENGFQCFIEPSKPFIRKWFKKIDTSSTLERLAAAIESVLLGSGKVSQLRWLPENEADA